VKPEFQVAVVAVATHLVALVASAVFLMHSLAATHHSVAGNDSRVARNVGQILKHKLKSTSLMQFLVAKLLLRFDLQCRVKSAVVLVQRLERKPRLVRIAAALVKCEECAKAFSGRW
jgi:hypothetical protein